MISIHDALKKVVTNPTPLLVFIIIIVFFMVVIRPAFTENGNVAVAASAGWTGVQGAERPPGRIPDTSCGSAVFAEGMEIRSDASLLFLRHGSVQTNKYHGGRNGVLKKILGFIFAPLFYCFYHPVLFLCVGLCLAILFACVDELMHVEEKFPLNHKENSKMFEGN